MAGNRTGTPWCVIVVCLVVLAAGAARACDDDDGDGLDVGLVLSGGGALATTHVGALTAIESLGIPIHCIVGTSMGSVVGALYAAGYDARSLRAVFRDSRWPEVFSGHIGRRDEPYLRKEQDDLYFSGYVAGFGPEGLRLPAGFRSMAGLKLLYRQLLFEVPYETDFDDLPIPFRAVAMDLASGEAVALGSGDLVDAMLASMAVPGVFAPRVVDGRTLVDGGMAAQLPVSVAREMGADVIIALDTTVEPPAADPDWSAAQVSQQLIRLTVWNNWQAQRAQLSDRDVLLRPDLNGLTTSSFQRAARGFASGEAEARAQIEQLEVIKRLAAPARPAAPAAQPPRPADIEIANSSAIRDELILRRLNYQPDDLDDPVDIQHRLRSLASFGPFGETDLVMLDPGTAQLSTSPHPLGRNLLNVGLHASNNFEGDSRYAVLGRYSRRPLAGSGSELRISGQVGSDSGLVVELYQPFGPEGRFFAVPSLSYEGKLLVFDLNDVRIGEFWQQTGEARLRLGRELGDWGIVAIDAIGAYDHARTKIAVVDVPETFSATSAGAGLLFGIDTLDQSDWPSGGVQLKATAERLHEFGSDGGTLDRLGVDALKPLSFGNFGLLLHGDARSLITDDEAPIDIFRLGGFRRLSSFADNSLLAERYQFGSVELFRRLNPSQALFSVPMYVGLLVEYAEIEFDALGPDADDHYQSVGAYLGTDTALGPFFFGAALGSDDSRSVYMHFGRTF